MAAWIASGVGDVKTAPGTAASNMPGPTNPPCSGSWPEPPPDTTPTLPDTGASALATTAGSYVIRSRSGWAAAMPRRESTTTVDGSLMIFFIAAPPWLRCLLFLHPEGLGSTSVTQAYQPQQPTHGMSAAPETHRPQRQPEPLPGHRLGPGELAQPVLAVNPPETGVAGTAERQRGHGGERQHRVDRHHAGAQPGGQFRSTGLREQ